MLRYAFGIFVSALIALQATTASAADETKEGRVEEIMTCADDSGHGIGLILIKGVWIEISDTAKVETQQNFDMAMAAFLSGKTLELKYTKYSSPPSRCRKFPRGYMKIGYSYNRLYLKH